MQRRIGAHYPAGAFAATNGGRRLCRAATKLDGRLTIKRRIELTGLLRIFRGQVMLVSLNLLIEKLPQHLCIF